MAAVGGDARQANRFRSSRSPSLLRRGCNAPFPSQELSRDLYLRTGEKPQILDERAASGNAIRFRVDSKLWVGLPALPREGVMTKAFAQSCLFLWQKFKLSATMTGRHSTTLQVTK